MKLRVNVRAGADSAIKEDYCNRKCADSAMTDVSAATPDSAHEACLAACHMNMMRLRHMNYLSD